MYQFQHGPEKKDKFFIKTTEKVMKQRISLAAAQHLFTGTKMLKAGGNFTSEKLSEAAEHSAHTTYLLEIYQSIRTKFYSW